MSTDVEVQAPRIHHVPPYISTAGQEAIEVAEVAGLFLDPWEQLVINDALGETSDGRWAAYRVGLEVPRQNGKGAILEARELAGLFAFGERLIIHSAHEQATATEHFNRMLNLMQGVPEFDRRIMRAPKGKGSEAIELRGGQRIFFKTRTGGGGRGFTGDLVVFDEAMILAAAFMAALVPTMAARSISGDPQLWFAGSAVDQQKTEHGVEFARVRADALADGERLAYFGYNADYDDPSNVPAEALDDPDVWAQANPGLGIRISESYVADERKALGAREFAVERLGIGDWPDPDPEQNHTISLDAWNACKDPNSELLDPICVAFDVRPNRAASAIAAAGIRADGRMHIEVIEHRAGTGWVAERLAELVEEHDPISVVCAKRSPAASLLTKIADVGITVQELSTEEHADGCGQLYDAFDQHTLRHRGTAELEDAVRGAVQRPYGDAWVWSRTSSSVDICPLVACTLAVKGFTSAEDDSPFVFEVFN